MGASADTGGDDPFRDRNVALRIRSPGYSEEGRQWEYWNNLFGGLDGDLVVEYSYRGIGYDGRLNDAVIEEWLGVMEEPEDKLQLVLGLSSADMFTDLFANGSAVSQDKLSSWFDSKTATFGGQDAVDTVKQLVGNVQRFDFENAGRDLPKVDLPDLLPFLRHALALNSRRLTEDDGRLAFITPDAWRNKDFALLPRYDGLVLDRKLKGRDAASA